MSTTSTDASGTYGLCRSGNEIYCGGRGTSTPEGYIAISGNWLPVVFTCMDFLPIDMEFLPGLGTIRYLRDHVFLQMDLSFDLRLRDQFLSDVISFFFFWGVSGLVYSYGGRD